MWCGRKARRQADSGRPEYMWAEEWPSLGPKDKRSVSKDWKSNLKRRVALARQNRQIKSYVQTTDADDYHAKVRAAQTMFSVMGGPAMSLQANH